MNAQIQDHQTSLQLQAAILVKDLMNASLFKTTDGRATPETARAFEVLRKARARYARRRHGKTTQN